MPASDQQHHHRRRRHRHPSFPFASIVAAQPSLLLGQGGQGEGGGDEHHHEEEFLGSRGNPLSSLLGRLLPFAPNKQSSPSSSSFRPSARFLSSRLGKAWLEQLESQRALLTGAAGAAARAAGAADAAGRARLADARATLGAQLAWDRAKAEWLASQLLEAGENGERERSGGGGGDCGGDE